MHASPKARSESAPPANATAVAQRLRGRALPALALLATDGTRIQLDGLRGVFILYVYTWTGRPGAEQPEHWDDIPGAHGSTPQSQAFRDAHADFQALGAGVLGVSVQDSAWQREARARLALPFPLLSDARMELKTALGLPTFFAGAAEFYRRITLLTQDATIRHVIYPVTAPEHNAAEALAWLRAQGTRA